MRALLSVSLLACLCPGASAEPPAVPFDARPSRPVPAEAVPTVRAASVAEFVRSFEAASGPARYEAFVVHPCTGQPVRVCLDLPGCPRRIVRGKTEVVFRYGLCKKPVTLTFCRDGTVSVR